MSKNALEIFERMFFREKTFVMERDLTPAAVKLKNNRMEIADLVREVGKGGALDLILAVERRFMENDLVEYANSPAMKRSLDTAMIELRSAERHVAIVNDPARYKAVDEAHSLSKNRKGPLPYDEARQFFNSHAARLLNMDKSRLDAEEKKIIEARKQNMRAADKLYAALQSKALGLPPPQQEKGQGLGR